MAITITLDGPAAMLSEALDAFVRQGGWTELSSMSQLDFARTMIAGYLRETAAAWNAQQAAEQARNAAIEATTQAVSQLTLTLTSG